MFDLILDLVEDFHTVEERRLHRIFCGLSMSRRGNCYDNAMAENFFSCIKTECIYRQKIQTIQQAKHLVDEYIWFYNNERIQLKTKLTPLEQRRQFTS